MKTGWFITRVSLGEVGKVERSFAPINKIPLYLRNETDACLLTGRQLVQDYKQ